MEIMTFENLKSGNQVRFVHSSVKILLRGKYGLCRFHPDFSTKLEEGCQLFLFETCLRILGYCRLRDNDDVKCLDYACTFWLRHAQKSDDILETIGELPNFMLDCTTKKATRVIKVTAKSIKMSQARENVFLEDQSGMLVLLANMGCTTLLHKHLQTCSTCKEACTSCDTGTYRVALNNSIIGRSPDTASYLLETGSPDINSLHENTTLLYETCYFDCLRSD